MTDLSRAQAFVSALPILKLAPDELAHYGVLGQRWGHRKPESIDRDRREERNARNTRRKLAVGTLGASIAVSKIAGQIRTKRQYNVDSQSDDHKAAQELLKKKTPQLSNSDIQRIVDRLQKEKKLKDLNPTNVERGKKIVLGLVAASGTAILVYDRVRSPAGQAAIRNGRKIVMAMGLKVAETIVKYS